MKAASTWIEHINRRAQLAVAWAAELTEHKKLAEKGIYIRIGAGQYRPISVVASNPCGRLLWQQDRAVLGGANRIGNAIQSVNVALPPDAYQPANRKPEHQMQAALIRHALCNDLYLHCIFDGFSEIFDELLFVTDELSAGDIRLDVIALAGKAGNYFPLLIELKANRALGRVTEQLRLAKEAMKLAGEPFIELLTKVTGKPRSAISFEDARLLILWPDSPSGKEQDIVIAARSEGYLTGSYKPDGRVVRVVSE